MTVDLRLAIPAAIGWTATALLVAAPEAALAVAVLLWALGAVAVVLALRWRWVATIALACIAAALCSTAIAVLAPARQPEWVVAAVESGRALDARLVPTEGVTPGIRSWEARLVALDGLSLDTPVVVFGGAAEGPLEPGSEVGARVDLELTEAGDRAAFLVFPVEQVSLERAPPESTAWSNSLRAGFRAASAHLPGAGGELLAGLAIGDTSLVSEQLDDAMKASSLSHLTAVSGANCAIVVGLVMLVGGALGLPRLARVVASLVVLAAFVVLVTPEPSVQRAAVMAGVVLVLVALGRPVRGVPVLALAVMGLLVVDPWLARSYGFVLSVLATAGLLLVAAPLARTLERFLPRWLALVVAVPAAAQLACQPVLILLDATIPTYGVAANILAAPAAPLATVIGLAACALLPVLPPLGAALCAIAWAPAAWIGSVALVAAELPASRIPWIEGPGGALVLVTLSGAAVVAVVAVGRWRTRAVFVLLTAVIAYAAITGTIRALDSWTRPADWQYAACDVGQGDAMVVRSTGQVALVDTGADPELVRACLDDLGISRVDLLVLTHFDHDHAGGSAAVVGRTDRVLAGPTGSAEDEALLASFEAAGAQVDRVARGEQGLLGDLRWTVLWPPVRGAPEPGNDASVTVGFEGVGACPRGCLSSLFLGDLGEEAQRSLMRLGGIGAVDVVKVSHHGSADQSAELYGLLRATAGLIGVGEGNGYGHPTPALLELLEAAGTTPFRTDTGGLIMLAPGGGPGAVVSWMQRSP